MDKVEDFSRRLRDSISIRPLGRAIHKRKREMVYTCGDAASTVYLIESGKIKSAMFTSSGKECLLAIYSTGEIFGESAIANVGARQETAIAMVDSVVREIPTGDFLCRLASESLYEDFLRTVVRRLSLQQEIITNLLTVDSEQRLGRTLLHLADKLGRKHSESSRIEMRISQEELSMMVGTTRPRISLFMRRFRSLGLIAMSPERFLMVNESALSDYLARLE